MASDDKLRELEERFEGFTVYDRDGDKIGKVDDLFVDDEDREEYIGVKMGLFGLSGTTLIPMEIARVDEREKRIEVSVEKDQVKDAPTYSGDDDVTVEYEERIREYFGLGRQERSEGRGSYGRESGAAAGAAAAEGSMDRGERGGTDREREGVMDRGERGGDVDRGTDHAMERERGRDDMDRERGGMDREREMDRERGMEMDRGERGGMDREGGMDRGQGMDRERARIEDEGVSRGERGDREDLDSAGERRIDVDRGEREGGMDRERGGMGREGGMDRGRDMEMDRGERGGMDREGGMDRDQDMDRERGMERERGGMEMDRPQGGSMEPGSSGGEDRGEMTEEEEGRIRVRRRRNLEQSRLQEEETEYR